MTRKEMIFKLKHTLDNLEGVCTNKIKADILLSEIERLGMLPPLVSKLKKYNLNSGSNVQYVENIEQLNEWEND